MGPTKQELHELPDTEIEKSGTIRCASVWEANSAES